MLALRINGAHPALGLRKDMDRVFDRFFTGGLDWPFGSTQSMDRWGPALDVSETDTEFSVQAELPGVDPKDVDISITGRSLTLSGQKKESTERKDANCYHSECRFGSFSRSLELPESVDPDKVSAEHKNGVLMIRLPKRESETPKRITVETVKE